MAYVDWSIRGPELGNCNCIYACPCQFNALPSHGNCEAVVGMRIDEGHFGTVRLDGLHWAGTYWWPGPVHEGGGKHQLIVDERADAAQREAIETICRGGETEPMATHLSVYAAMVEEVFETLYQPIEFEVDVAARRGRIVVPGVIEVRGEPIRNPVTGAEHRVRIDLPHGFEYSIAEIGSATSKTAGAIALDLNDSYGQFAMIHLTPSGPVRA